MIQLSLRSLLIYFQSQQKNKRQNTDIRMQSPTRKLETLLYDESWFIKKHETQIRSLKY